MEQPGYFTFGIQADRPPSLEGGSIVVRTDEINTIIGLMSEARTRTVLITGTPGVGKSVLAAQVFQHLESQTPEGLPSFQHYIWLRAGPRATWPDIASALLNALQFPDKQDALISQRVDLQTLYEALCRPEQGALVVLDQCEELFDRVGEAQNQAAPYTVGVGLSSTVRFLEMLHQDLGESRFVLTCTRSPYGSDPREAPGVLEYKVGGLTVVEGIQLLQQYNVMGLQQDLLSVWQRCSGHAYTLILFGALKSLSGLSLHYLLNSPAYQILWDGDITRNLVEATVSALNPVQMSLVRALCLFREAAPLVGITQVVTSERAHRASDPKVYEQEMNNLAALGLVEHIGRYDGEVGYQLHELLSKYLLSHYLESEQHKASSYTSSLGVANQPDQVQASTEARNIALAAGHICVASYYQALAQQNCPPYQQRHNPNEVTPLLAMLEHLCLGWHWQTAYDQLYAQGLDEDLLHWEIWHTLIRLYEMILPPIGSLKRKDEGVACSMLAMVYSRLGEYEQSRSYFTSALAIQQDMSDQEGEAITLINQGEFLRILGDRELARKNLEQAGTLVQPQTHPELACILLHNMAMLTQQEGDFQQSLSYFLQSLQLVQQIQNREREGMILTNLGLLLCQQGRYPEGLALLFPALQMRRAQNDRGIESLIAFLNKIEQKMGHAAFAHLRQSAETPGKQEQVLRMLASRS
jgi:tetratricopeptide (TPR) repeat protein